MKKMSGKVAVVTGAASGIGRSIAHRLAAEGAAVVVTDIQEQQGLRVVEEIGAQGGTAVFIRCDVGSRPEIEDLYEAVGHRFKQLDIVVNNASLIISKYVQEATMDDWRQVSAVNLESVWHGSNCAVPLMTRGGSIVNISSMHAVRTTLKNFPYSTVKAAVLSLTQSMSMEYGPLGIRVNAVCPGLIRTPMTEKFLAQLEEEQAMDRVLSVHPLGRIGEPEDIAGPVFFLASDDSAFMTGTALYVDGGRHAIAYSYGDPK
jgi:NAD(P)-dependent dehydrogenase (short-subunit alcohol dehydrogenase family)